MKTVSLIDLLLSLFDSTLSVPSVMFIGMTKATEKDLETLGEAARRLLAELDERLKRPAAERAAEIHASPEEWSLVPGEKRPGERMQFALKLSRPVVVIRWGAGAQTNVLRLAANGNRYDSALFWEDEAIVLDYDEW